MRLAELLPQVDVLDVSGSDVDEVDVRAVTRDSRQAGPGVVWVAIRGGSVDGHRFAGEIADGVVVVEEPVQTRAGVVVVRVADSRLALAQIAAALHGHPARLLPVVGLTGTNGKTTIASLCADAMTHLGRRGGRIGTLGAAWGESEVQTGLTTPEAPALHGVLAQMQHEGVEAAFVEVSSIALDQRRADALPFHTVVFTNLSRDHLDFHGTMQAYAAAKAQLFDEARLRPAGGLPRAVLCGDDPAWRDMGPPDDRWLYGFEAHNDVRIEELRLTAQGQGLRVRVPGRQGVLEVETSLVGSFNALNVVAALCVLRTLGRTWEEAARGVAGVTGVPGRLQRVGPVQADARVVPSVFVDYAHTPDALKSALLALRPLVETPARICGLTVVIGCGGDRDAGKRPEMGRVAAEHADRVVLTSDNPRSEDPLAILRAMREGIPAELLREGVDGDAARVVVEPDRARAIALAVASRGGVVLIAGKGHEATQEIDGEKLPFDDVEVAGAILQRRAVDLRAASPVELNLGLHPACLFDAEGLAAATGGQVLRALPAEAAGRILTDTRKDLSGAWFLALSGERFDGHRYLQQARDQGAIGVVVSHLPENFDLEAWHGGLVQVDDTTQAMADLGRRVARSVERPIVGITGSSGKTTTRALTACALTGAGLQVHQTVGNLNNHLGVPMTLLATPRAAEVLVVEMGTSSPGEIAHLARTGLPTHRLIINVGPAHLEELGGLAGVATEKGALFDTARRGDVLLVNLDDPHLRDWVVRAPAGARVLTWGRHADADVCLVGAEVDADALTTTGTWRVRQGAREIQVAATIPAFGLHFASNATAALALAVALGLKVSDAAAGLSDYAPVGMRQRVERLASGALVLNDAYNANPDSVRSALSTLQALGGRGVAALGDMLELGTHEARMHIEILQRATELGTERVLVVGPRFAAAARAVSVSDNTRIEVFETPEQAGEALRTTLTSEHRLLIKGSRGMAMERILQSLQAER